uniref:Uncharacterized protein n=1 Tax=Knipowitschia caucasica TaxID=637954 RepID=A0AAV2MH77_KNICA
MSLTLQTGDEMWPQTPGAGLTHVAANLASGGVYNALLCNDSSPSSLTPSPLHWLLPLCNDPSPSALAPPPLH